MKILYVTDLRYIQQASGFANDYLNDLLFYGLYEIMGTDIIDSTRIDHMYLDSRNNSDRLWGKGFSQTFLIDQDNVDRSDLVNKISNKFFDYIIYGCCNKYLGGYQFVSTIYDPDKIIMIDGDDNTIINHQLASKHLYFKRELTVEPNANLKPIHFAIPGCKIRQSINSDTERRHISELPYSYHNRDYVYNTEQDYYNDYYNSKYAHTAKKAGWDCMRHYEIMANACIPLFSDIENCPKYTLSNMDKKLLKVCNASYQNISNDKIQDLSQEILDFTQSKLTTKTLAKYVMEHIVND